MGDVLKGDVSTYSPYIERDNKLVVRGILNLWNGDGVARDPV